MILHVVKQETFKMVDLMRNSFFENEVEKDRQSQLVRQEEVKKMLESQPESVECIHGVPE